MITKELIEDGIRANLISFETDPNMGNGTYVELEICGFISEDLRLKE